MKDRKPGWLWQAFAGVVALLLVLPVHAAIAPGTSQSGTNAAYSGIGELFLVVYDPSAKISYTKDLGLTQNEFFTLGQQDAGYQNFWGVDKAGDPYWKSFLDQTAVANLRWAVLAIDQTGGTPVGAVRLFTTVQQGDENKIIDVSLIEPGKTTGLSTMTNQLFSQGMGSSQAGTFFNAVNSTGSHGVAGQAPVFASNGSSVNADSDSGNSYFGDGSIGLSSNLNGNATFSMANELGKSSWFYYVTRSGGDQLGYAQVDEFDNLGADGYWGFTYVDPAMDPTSPYAGQYALSYTLAAAGQTQAQIQFAANIGRTEYSSGYVTRLQGLAAATAGESQAGWTQRLGGLSNPGLVSPVPEPAAFWLLALGGALVLRAARRRA